MNAKIEIEIEIDVAAPRERVFEALTRPDPLERWFAEKAFVSLEEERFDFWGRYTPGNPGPEDGHHSLRAIESPRTLAFDWCVRGEKTHVDLELEETATGTLLKLTRDPPPRDRNELSLADF